MREVLAVALLLLAGCGESLPLVLQNQSPATLTVDFSSKDGKCDPPGPERLAPSERLLARCAPADLVNVTVTMADGRNCSLSQAQIAGLVEERKGMKGSFLLPIKGC